MPSYDHALIVTIEADSYEESEKIAYKMADGLGDSEELFVVVGHVWGFNTDNDGQRVFYLHPEGATNEWEPNNA